MPIEDVTTSRPDSMINSFESNIDYTARENQLIFIVKGYTKERTSF